VGSRVFSGSGVRPWRAVRMGRAQSATTGGGCSEHQDLAPIVCPGGSGALSSRVGSCRSKTFLCFWGWASGAMPYAICVHYTAMVAFVIPSARNSTYGSGVAVDRSSGIWPRETAGRGISETACRCGMEAGQRKPELADFRTSGFSAHIRSHGGVESMIRRDKPRLEADRHRGAGGAGGPGRKSRGPTGASELVLARSRSRDLHRTWRWVASRCHARAGSSPSANAPAVPEPDGDPRLRSPL